MILKNSNWFSVNVSIYVLYQKGDVAKIMVT